MSARLKTCTKTWFAILLACGLAAPAVARGPTAGEWLSDCSPYLAFLEGADGDDLDITYCTGLTLGILSGLDTGAQIGAVSMASALTIMAELEEQEVLGVFRQLGTEGLLRYCLRPDVPISEIVTGVAAHLRATPDQAGLPATAVFFEALQAAYPCAKESPERAGDDSK